MNKELVKDTSWLRAAFLYAGGQVTDRQRYRRSKGWLKFTDTTLGGNTAINAPYQFCRYADIKERRLLANVGKGMGRWYSENIDDWGHNVHFRVGVPAYTGVISYALRAIDGPTARYVATGRMPGILDTVGRIVGWVMNIAFWEITIFSSVVMALLNLKHSRFYYLKPTMPQYWRTVQTILNTLSANIGLTIAAEERDKDEVQGYKPNTDSALIESARKALPETFRDPVASYSGHRDVGIDIHAVASRAQGLQIKHQIEMQNQLQELPSGMTPERLAETLENILLNGPVAQGNIGQLKPVMHNPTLDAYEKSFSLSMYRDEIHEDTRGKDLMESLGSAAAAAKSDTSNKDLSVSAWFQNSVDSFEQITGNNESQTWQERLLAEFRDGSQWFSFRVSNAIDPVSESFSNSSEKSEVGEIFNKISSAARTATFNLSGGKTGIGAIDASIEAVTGAVGDIISGAVSSNATLSFLNPVMGLLYGAQIDAPKRWSSSSTSNNNTSFKLELRCGYGNRVSYFQDILVPLAMVLALSLPRGTGPQSYGSPFYVQYYSKGRGQVKVGLVSSLSITRGVGNAPWSKHGFPMGVDIDISIEDMSSTMFTPVAQAINLSQIGWFNAMEESMMGDYMAVLSALGMNEQEYFIPKIRRRFASMVNEFNSWTSPHRWSGLIAGGWFHDLSAFADQTSVRN